MTTQPNTPDTVAERLKAGEPYVLAFGGQATPWRSTLEELVGLDRELAAELVAVDAAVADRLAPVATDLLTVTPRGARFFTGSGAPVAPVPQGAPGTADTADVSVPGILFAQHAVLSSLPGAGVDPAGEHAPGAVIGHSQGVLGVSLLQAQRRARQQAEQVAVPDAVVQVHAIARLIGAAAARTTGRLNLGTVGESTPMLSVRGVTREILDGVLARVPDSERIAVGVVNGRLAHILSGRPADLERVVTALEAAARRSERDRKDRRRGGAVLSPVTEFLTTSVPFHTPLLAGAVDDVVAWAARADLDQDLARKLATDVLIDPVDWPATVSAALGSGETARGVIVDLGPGTVLSRLTEPVVAGTGVTVVPAGTARNVDDLDRPGAAPVPTVDRARFAPRLTQLPDGRVTLDTAFTRLTGRSAILLAGMTPTTVDPEIVAAAANAGYWAELAGGGQTTAKVLADNLAGLEEALEPGRTAAFNAMFMDRYLWNLHLGTQRLLSKARASGTPVDGVVISAGIPELDEAVTLINRLRGEGFPYVAFKPGTVDQIRQVITIAKAVPDVPVIMQIEDGHAGGHHSWEDLDTMLLATYDAIRAVDNIVLCVGGGIGAPERAADYITGRWAEAYGTAAAPVDGVCVGTAAMTCLEAKTNEDVKQLLVDTPGIDPAHEGGWVASGASAGGMTSGLSHLRADLYEIDNSSARASRLIQELAGDDAAMTARREEMIAALAKTAKPYFGDVEDMSYLEWATRYAQLCVSPHAGRAAGRDDWADEGWYDRFLDLLHRIEARLSNADNGEIPTLFASEDDVLDADAALAALAERYPAAATTEVEPADAAWFVDLCRKHPKPVPFVPVLDADILRWWGTDSLWQSQDPRYTADQVRIIPGPVSVAGITTINEPVGQLLGRFESAVIDALRACGQRPTEAAGRLGASKAADSRPVADATELVRATPHVLWNGHLTANPARVLADDAYRVVARPDVAQDAYDLDITLDTHWDDTPGGEAIHAVRRLVVPLRLARAWDGAAPFVDPERISETMYDLLRATAGVGAVSITGDLVEQLPEVVPALTGAVDALDRPAHQPFGTVHARFTLADTLGADHAAVTADALPTTLAGAPLVPDALLGPCWPVVYAALGSVVEDGMPLIEGLLGAVHLDHTIDLRRPLAELASDAGPDRVIQVDGWVAALEESSAGRVVDVRLQLTDTADGGLVALMRERFAVRGRASGTAVPSAPEQAGGTGRATAPAARRLLRRITVTAPSDMTAFARVTGDFNPIHTSYHAARVAGMHAPLVHGMWLSATAQQAAAATATDGTRHVLAGWTYTMLGPVELGDRVQISVERTGLVVGGGLVLEVTCRVGDEVVSRGTAVTEPEPTAYIFPGQGIQARGMGLDEMRISKAARQVWERADAHTRAELGFSVIALVRDNPTEMTARGVTYRHPDGLLNLTQFTQVALATVAMATTARLAEAGALVESAAFAGHSLGEYTALSAYGRVMSVETTISIVFQRGSTMHSLVPRDEVGASNYRMGALRPNQAGIPAADVEDYIRQVSEASGEFLQIVNYNLAGVQYAVAGTIKGLEALAADARAKATARGGKNPFMYVPGIDVPFHSEVLRPGVPEFRERLLALVPENLDVDRLVGRYVPNLVARPFALTRDFASAILEVVPSEPVREILNDWQRWDSRPTELGRQLLVELLAWQFASPVRWIETQDVLLDAPEQGGLGVEHMVEVGLAASPTLANLASRTLALPRHAGRHVSVHNARRDESRVLATDTDPAPGLEEESLDEPAGGTAVDSAAAPAQEAAAPDPTPAEAAPAAPAANAPAASGPVADLPFTATDALTVLLAHAARILPEQIAPTDTTESLTNGVSSRRNQLLMDLGTELQLASIDGAADADMNTLAGIVAKGAPGYKAFGPVLADATRTGLGRILGPSGVRAGRIADRVTGTWGLGDGWVSHVTAEIFLGTREGASMRGEDLASLGSSAPLTNAGAVDALIDAAVQAVASAHGVSVSMPSAGGTGGAVVDSAALDAFAAQVTGADGVLATTARTLLDALGLAEKAGVPADADDEAAATRAAVEAIDAELGTGWVKSVTPAFSADRAVLIDDRWASARDDLARLGNGEMDLSEARALLTPARFTGLGSAVADQAAWWARQLRAAHAAGVSSTDLADRAEIAEAIATAAANKPVADADSVRWAQDVAVVTGVAPGSIAAAVVGELLAGGATVVATSSRLTHERLAFATRLYREHASAGARLWMVPANLASYRDVDALADWIGNDQTVTSGGSTQLVKEALVPTLLFPFAAPRVVGTLADAGPAAESQTRLLLWSVERTIAALSAIGTDTHVDHRLHVVLPGSPNRGTFGGDGAYGEVKSALDAVVNRWRAEKNWSGRVTLAHPRIGWVRGTGLMGGNDPLVAAVEAAGVRTWSTQEIATELVQLCTTEVRGRAAQAPVQADLTGGLGDDVDLVALRESARATAPAAQPEPEPQATIKALPTPHVPTQPTAPDWGEVDADLEDLVVVVSTGEVSTWGSGRTRREAELGMSAGDDVELTAAGVLELAWGMGLLTWQDSPKAGWYDTDGEFVDESDVFTRYRDEVVARCGIREFVDDGVIATEGPEEVAVYLDHDITLTVADEVTARTIEVTDPEHTLVAPELADGQPTGEWTVTRLAGSLARVPRRATLSRTVGGQFPVDFDPERWGIPASMVQGMDTIASWNLVTAVDAFLSAGFSPAELLAAVHPSDVASTQGTGFGGMESMRKMFVGRFLGEERPSDILQEALPNVVAAHVMQSYVGGYGSMVQPVSACATAAVSIEEGWDKIALGKADVVVAGAIDDISIESVVGFGNMNATAEAAAMYAKGISARHFSRANDRRRGGFVEAEGGGTVILARGSVAARLGLPVAGVIGFVSSYADGAHTSIPAPGLGALGAGRGGKDSRLAKALAALGVEADDIAVISKHDTSTNANDPNESELHTRLARALGRSEGNPLVAVSQKTITGHAKGGAALFQVAGLAEILATGIAPGNASLDVVDAPLEKDAFWVWPRTPIRLAGRGGAGGRVPGAGPVRAGLLTSLGFGHVSGLIAIVHPGAFEAALRAQGGQEAVDAWVASANRRLAAGTRQRRAGMIGRAPLFEQIDGRRLGEERKGRDPHEVEAAMLLDPQARLGA
ncbi:type I polyketide synthase, partial [Actinomyces qiguomingii]